MSFKITVIIPMFNARETLALPLSSLARQDFPTGQFEAVLVDDGSVDGSIDAAREFLRGVAFEWKILEAQHCGVSAARNLGIEASRGECLFFLDADDELPPDFLSIVHGGMEEKCADVAWVWKVSNSAEMRVMKKHPLCGGKDGLSCLESYLRNPWNAQVMVRKSFLESSGIRYTEGLAYAEDVDFFVRLLLEAKQIHVETRTCYIYKKNPYQVTRNIDRIAARKAVDEAFRRLAKWLREQKAPHEIVVEMKKSETKARINLLREALRKGDSSLFRHLIETKETKEALRLARKGLLSGKWYLRSLIIRLFAYYLSPG